MKRATAKMIVHRFGEAEQVAYDTTWSTQVVCPSGEPTATFTFCYRSREALQAMLIIPRDEQRLEDRDLHSLSATELGELQRRAREFRDQQEEEMVIKKEPASPRRRKAARNGDITVIELDEDGNVLSETTTAGGVAPEGVETIEVD